MGIKYDEKRKNWAASYSKRHPTTRQPYSLRRINLKSKAEAQRVEKELVLLVERKLLAKSLPTWRDTIPNFCRHSLERGLAFKTVDNSRICLEAHTLKDWGDKLVSEITTEDIRSLIKIKLAGRSLNHQKNVHKFIRMVFSYLVEGGVLQRNPAPQMKFRSGDKIKKVLTAQHIRLLLNKAKSFGSKWYPHWAMALYTGMRNGELYALTWDNVDLENRAILVNTSWNGKDGFKSTKTGDDRVVEIAPNLLHLLKELRLESDDRIFVLPRITEWDKGDQARSLRMFLMGLGLEPVRFHDLRASWATAMLSRGVEPIKVMSMGGWKDIKTMMIYARKAGVDIKGITNNLDLHRHEKVDAQVINAKSRFDR